MHRVRGPGGRRPGRERGTERPGSQVSTEPLQPLKGPELAGEGRGGTWPGRHALSSQTCGSHPQHRLCTCSVLIKSNFKRVYRIPQCGYHISQQRPRLFPKSKCIFLCHAVCKPLGLPVLLNLVEPQPFHLQNITTARGEDFTSNRNKQTSRTRMTAPWRRACKPRSLCAVYTVGLGLGAP